MARRICYFPECGRVVHGNGLCNQHRLRERQGRPLIPLSDRIRAMCSFPGCDLRANAKGLCLSHRVQQRKGRALTPLPRYEGRRPSAHPDMPGAMLVPLSRGRDTGYWAVTYRPLLPFTVIDPVLWISWQEGVALNQEQADALRRRVVEVRASLQRWADFWGMTVAAVARVRLAEIAAERQGRIERLNGLNRPSGHEIIGAPIEFQSAAREWGRS